MRRTHSITLLFGVLAIAGGCDRCGKTGGEKTNTTGVVDLAIGSGQACVRMIDKSIYCWGSNSLGSVGVKGKSPTQQFHSRPVRVENVTAEKMLLVGIRSCVEPPEGGLVCWGGPLDNVDARPKRVDGVPKGRLYTSHSVGCVLDAGGTATCWGEDTSGRISPRDDAAAKSTWGKPMEPAPLAIGVSTATIAIGGRHGCAIGEDRKVRCWGLNNFGQLGVESYPVQERAQPTIVDGIDDVEDLVAGYFYNCALRKDRSVWCWGRGDHGELGIGEALQGTGEHRHSATPVQVSGLDKVDRLFAQNSTTCAIRRGELRCWGQNDKGQIGDGTSEDRFVPVRVKGLEAVKHVAVGFATTCALTASGEVHCWGENRDGMLGNGSVESSPVPVKVDLPKIGAPAATPPPAVVKPSAMVAYESLACGFRMRAPGKRVHEARDDLIVDAIAIEPLVDTKIVARCTKRKSQADKDPDALAKRFAGFDAAPAITRKQVGGAECIEATLSAGRSLYCFATEHFIDLSVLSKDSTIVGEVLGSLELFDPKTALPTPPAPAPDPKRPGKILVPAGEFAMGCANVSLFDKAPGGMGCIEDAQPMHRVRLSAYAIDEKRVGKNVTWEEAKAECASKKERLPSEAEWERALRSGAIQREDKEWVADVFAKTYFVESPLVDPKGPAAGIHRVVRGLTFGPGDDALMFRHGLEPSSKKSEIGFRCAVSAGE